MYFKAAVKPRAVLRVYRNFSCSSVRNSKHSCKLLIVGGGTGGCSVAAKFAKCLKKKELYVLEASEDHYYQPLFTLVGGGMETLEESRKNEADVLPKNCTWLKSNAVRFDPMENTVTAQTGDVIKYDFLLVAVGLELRYDKIPGLEEALSKPSKSSGVCSNYSPKYVNRTWEVLQQLTDGNAFFTFPNSPVKCPGAPQKICYIADAYLRKEGRREKVNVTYNTSLPVIFGVKKYADALWKVCKERDINVNLRTNLIGLDSDKKEATFQNLDKPEIKTTTQYSMLHVTPPMATPQAVSSNTDLSNAAGFVEVNNGTLQHIRFPNIFAIGDCSSSPNSKTAAAAAAQCEIIHKNLCAVMEGRTPEEKYDGYASCPLVTGYDKCILAEFDYNLSPLETFPFSQDKEMRSMFMLKKSIMPPLYWHLMLNGYWNGPSLFRKIMHLDFAYGNKRNPAKQD
ncbi:unnamed protein product [Acanthoscelides obtectus]|uniref:Sulfide:quinone oxidoreductase, mitochondrial n=1 Tax=Acanthoscelides obtectus TaxID=200917 RepID=A0A9P0Q203_ACAOB|nr:unnamed protein product [Acanthoscelides obtectus]CAH2011086.1 unnamed protein product [Acanthoscelides obtectus]CAK1676051.1 Sulfide:quinone oxidoreductase, mitochondrial [Acanthoscelides obtectus]CAK1676073.1 Sulfide:quinone oxidoreductase, mitochondrial [Acanthoscelides obtectus]